MKVIDFHGHTDMYEAAGWFDPPEQVVRLMDRAGIDITCVTTYGEAPDYPGAYELVNWVKQFPDRLIGFGRVNPATGARAVAAVEEFAKYPDEIKGIKLHPVSSLQKPYGKLTVDVMKKAAECGLPVFIHCCEKVAAQPWEIGYGAEQVPEATIICHMGGFFRNEEAIRMAAANPNVCLDTSSIPYPNIVKKAIDVLGADRVLFASDNPAGDPVSDLKKVLQLGLDEETLEKVLYKNACRIMGLKEIRGCAV